LGFWHGYLFGARCRLFAYGVQPSQNSAISGIVKVQNGFTFLVMAYPGCPTQVSRHQKGKTNLDFTEARDSEWEWHQLGHMQVCTSFQTDNYANTSLLVFYRPDAVPAAQPTTSKH